MAEPKTKPTSQPPVEFLRTIEPEQKREDSLALLEMFETITGEKGVMWGTSIVGFGVYRVAAGKRKKENQWPLIAFSPRKQNLTLYIMSGNKDDPALLEKLGKHEVSGVCLHINKLADVDQKVLATLIRRSFANSKKMF